jgi:hypothetical protein
VRTCFDIEERAEYHAARTLLIRRCKEWSRDRNLPADETLLMSALDSRHFSADGRLTYWTPSHVRHYLLEWVPRYLDAELDDLNAAPEVLRTLLRFIREYGLRDPRGGSPADNEAAIDAAATEFPQALHDVERFGLGKFWGRAARAHDVDINDARAVERFQDDVDAGRVELDDGVLERLLAAQYGHQPLGEERTMAQLPVHLPSRVDLARAAADSPAVTRLTALWRWVTPQGRPLDAAGELAAADRQDLVQALRLTGACDEADGAADDVHTVSLYLLWAKQIRLIRRYRGRLVPVAKSARLLSQPLELWRRAFDTVGQLRDEVCRAEPGDEPSMLELVYAETLPDVLNSLYSLPEPMPLLRLEETVWQHSCGAYFDIDALAPRQRDRQRALVVRDLNRMWQVLGELDAATFSTGIADDMFRDDLTGDTADNLSPFGAGTSRWLAEELSQPGRLITLTDLATAWLRRRMLAEGREAGLIGELADAEAPEMLSVVTQHYPARSRAEEVATWLAVHNADIEVLLDVARATPLRSRVAAILELVYDINPGAPKLLRRIRSDPYLGPAALVCLVETGVLELLDLTESERQLLTAESSLRLMEMDGPEAIIDGLDELPGVDVRAVLHRVLTSGHPDVLALHEFKELVAEPLAERNAARPRPPIAPPGRLGATRRARLNRRDET